MTGRILQCVAAVFGKILHSGRARNSSSSRLARLHALAVWAHNWRYRGSTIHSRSSFQIHRELTSNTVPRRDPGFLGNINWPDGRGQPDNHEPEVRDRNGVRSTVNRPAFLTPGRHGCSKFVDRGSELIRIDGDAQARPFGRDQHSVPGLGHAVRIGNSDPIHKVNRVGTRPFRH